MNDIVYVVGRAAPSYPMCHRSLVSLYIALVLFASACATGSSPQEDGYPQVLDEDLHLKLVAENPDIATPIGIAIDNDDRIFVLESHTHTPPQGYDGPESDQVKVFKKRDSDESLEFVSVFADGISDGMNLIIGPDDQLYVVSSRAVTRYSDHDSDGHHDSAEVVLEMIKPDYVYDHAGLLGIAISPDGWVYVSRGNTGSRYWKLVGTDGSYVEGYGDGGNIVRSRLNGSDVQEVATGFWNAFDLTFDGTGRLLAIDNDPDSRGPNRLLDIVDGGDYGYKSIYGGSGIHPYLAWDGELPGTLPFTMGLGEAPSGMLNARQAFLPDQYQNDILVTIWEESKIVSVDLREEEGVLYGESRDIVIGGPAFRPIAFATDSEGSIFFTDWVVREYPNHGSGRIWKLNALEGSIPQSMYADVEKSEPVQHRERIAEFVDYEDIAALEKALLSGDAHLRTIARGASSRPAFRRWIYEAARGENPALRVQAGLVIESLDVHDGVDIIEEMIQDEDEAVRLLALLWAGRHGDTQLGPHIEKMMVDGRISSSLFDTYLATLEQLQPEFIDAYTSQSEGPARAIKRTLPEGYLQKVLLDKNLPGDIRALVLARSKKEAVPVDVIQEALREGGPALQEVAIFFLMHHQVDGGEGILTEFIEQESTSDSEKGDAYLALSKYKSTLDAPDEQMASWGLASLNATTVHTLSEEEWMEVLEEKGNTERGRRIFFSERAQCSNCHVHAGWGGILGPDLTNVGNAKTPRQILNAILNPSAEIAPEWQGWFVKTSDGVSHYGRQIDVGLQSVELMTLNGEFNTFSDVVSYGVSPTSLMPEGLHYQLSVSDMVDLISFLMEP